MKESGGGTIGYSRKMGVSHRSNAHWPQGKCGGGQRHEIIDLDPLSTSQLGDLRQILMFDSHYMMMTINVCNIPLATKRTEYKDIVAVSIRLLISNVKHSIWLQHVEIHTNASTSDQNSVHIREDEVHVASKEFQVKQTWCALRRISIR